MKAFAGADVGTVNLGEPSKVADLIFFDGPLLSLYRNNEGENLLHYWCESGIDVNRWLIFKTPDADLEQYLRKQVTLRTLIQSPKDGFLYSIDFDARLEQRAALIVSPRQLPPEYLPSEDSFYEDEPIIEDSDEPTTLKVTIQGDWTWKDLNDFPRLFREAYAFVCQFRPDVAGLAALPRFPMRDGFSSVHLFGKILSSLPKGVSPSLRGVKYASPGAIMLNAHRGVTSTLLQTLESARSLTSPAAVTYNYLHGLLADKKLLGVNVLDSRISIATNTEIGKLATTLAEEMHLPNPKTLLAKSANALMAAKTILAFYRLIRERVLLYERNKRISIPILP
jgi:hypothetical protein